MPVQRTPSGIHGGARLYNAILDAGSRINRLVNPNPERLGTAAAQRLSDPIILIGGYASMPASLEPLQRSLRHDGASNVFIFKVPSSGLADIRHSAELLKEFVDEVRRKTGRAKVDLASHSAGGIVAREYVQSLGGFSAVDSLVTIATPHHGVRLLRSKLVNKIVNSPLLRWLVGPSTLQLMEGSALLKRLNSPASLKRLAQVRATSIFVDGFDGLLSPTDTAIIPGARNVRMRHANMSVRQAQLGHFTLHRRSARVYEAVRAALSAER